MADPTIRQSSPLPYALPEAVRVGFCLRPLLDGDAEALHRFYASLLPTTLHFFQPYSALTLETMQGVVRRTLDAQEINLVATEPGGRVFAHLLYRPLDVEVPHLGIGLLDEYQDLGLGTTFLAYLIAIGRHVLGKKRIGLTVMRDNRRALHVYQKFGFRVVREVTFRTTNDSYEMWLDFAEPCGVTATYGQ